MRCQSSTEGKPRREACFPLEAGAQWKVNAAFLPICPAVLENMKWVSAKRQKYTLKQRIGS